jgi:hypothetical protein
MFFADVTIPDECSIVNYIIEVLRLLGYCTKWILNRCIVTLHQVITISNNRFAYMVGVRQA